MAEENGPSRLAMMIIRSARDVVNEVLDLKGKSERHDEEIADIKRRLNEQQEILDRLSKQLHGERVRRGKANANLQRARKELDEAQKTTNDVLNTVH